MKIISTFVLALLFASNTEAATVTINDPSGIPDYYTAPAASSSELNIIGVYQTVQGSVIGHPQGNATVRIQNGGSTPMTLVLSSYEPTLWNLEIEFGVNINQIILNGYYEQSITGIDTSFVTNMSGLGNYLSACAYAWPSDTGGCNTQALVSGAEALTGLSLTSFSGTYQATNFTVVTSPVPLPSSIWLFVTGLGLLVRFKKETNK